MKTKIKILAVAILLMMMSVVLTGCLMRLPVPSVEKAELEFSITYEIDGEIKTYTGIYVCEFVGVHKSLYGESRDWKGYVKDNPDGEYSMIAIATNEQGIIYVDLGFHAEYFMADPQYAEYEAPVPQLYIIYHTDELDVTSSDHEDYLDFYEAFGVRIISYDFPEPIENEYEDKWKFGSFDFSIN